jgi:hypothetical protein
MIKKGLTRLRILRLNLKETFIAHFMAVYVRNQYRNHCPFMNNNDHLLKITA